MTFRYFVPLTLQKSDFIYSVDMLILKGRFPYNNDFLPWLTSRLVREVVTQNPAVVRDTYKQNYAFCQYHHTWNVELVGGSSFFLGYSLNGTGSPKFDWKIEFNPNKCLPNDFLVTLLSYLMANSVEYRVDEWDLAIDIPVERDRVHLVRRGKQLYKTVLASAENYTEYLSNHHEHGFTKLYNKQIESSLERPLTRLEVTLKSTSFADCQSVLPFVDLVARRSLDSEIELSKLNDTDRVLLELLSLHPEYYLRLGRNKREKLQSYISLYFERFQYDEKSIKNLCAFLSPQQFQRIIMEVNDNVRQR